MQNILLQLKVKNHIPEKINAIDMFGMHALWQTIDYVDYVCSMDIFEINKRYHELSKITLKNYPVKFYNLDSIQYIKNTNVKYNFIVADAPYAGDFYDINGLPIFFEDLIKISEPDSVIIFNCHLDKLMDYKILFQLIKNKVEPRLVKDLFFVVKSELVGTIILVIE